MEPAIGNHPGPISGESPPFPLDADLPGFGRGAFLLSLDVELAWGGIHNGEWRSRRPMYAGTRDAVSKLLALLERYEIRATWAFVGHLMLESCSSQHGVKHPEIARPEYPWRESDWFEDDPCMSAPDAPFWYAPDVLDSVLNCATPQEVGCHTFSHVLVARDGCGPACFASELAASKRAADRWNLDLRSFVFPRDEEAHHEVLSDAGFRTFRGLVLPTEVEDLPYGISRLRKGLQWVLPLPPLTARPRRQAAMWNLPATTVYYPRSGLGRVVPISLRVHRAVRGVEEALERGSLFHMYFHPFNLATDPDGLLGGLEEIFRRVNVLRSTGDLVNHTMGEVALELDTALEEGS